MKHLPWLLCVLLVVHTVSAQDTSASLVLEVRAERIDRSALEAALSKELSKGAAANESPSGQLDLTDTASNTVRLTYRDSLGRTTTRDLFLAPDDPEALEKVTIAAANLVRDQSALLAQLEAEQPAATPSASASAQVVPAVAATQKPVAPAYQPCKPELLTRFGADVVPGVGSSSTAFGRSAARRISLGLVGTYSAGVRGFELAVGINIARRGSCGAQLAAGMNLTIGPVDGVQLAVVNAAIGHVHGVQLGVANYAQGGVHGVQLGVTNLSLAAVRGQFGVANFAGGDSGIQLGVANLATGSVRSQLGVANVATEDTRLQLGVFNYARRARAPIGLLSIVSDGHTTLDAWASENGTLMAGLNHGGDLVHNIYGAGARVGRDGARLGFLLGIGVRAFTHPRFSLDVDALHELYPHLSSYEYSVQFSRLRLAGNIWLQRRVGILIAVGYALMIADDPSERTQAPFGESVFQQARLESGDQSSRTGFYGFPTFSVGLRVALSDPAKPRRR